MFRNKLVVAPLCLLAAGCRFVTFHECPDDDPPLVPFEAGTEWSYEVRSGFGFVDTLKVTIVGTIVGPDGATIALRSDSVSGMPVMPGLVQLWESASDGVHQRGVATAVDTLLWDVLAYPFPAEIGDSGLLLRYFNGPDGLHTTDSVSVRVEAVDTLIESAIGTKIANRYAYTVQPEHAVLTDDIIQLFSPGVGLVRQIRIRTGDPERIFSETNIIDYVLP